MKPDKRQTLGLSVLVLLAIGGSVMRWSGRDHGGTGPETGRAVVEPEVKAVRLGDGFGAWQAAFAGGSGKGEDLRRGIELARERRHELSALMKKDPSAALAAMMSYSEILALPEAVRAECEQPWSGTGSLDLQWETAPRHDDHTHCQHRNVAFVGKDSWRVYGPDFVEPHAPRTNFPMQGYRIGDELLLESSALHPVAGADLDAARSIFPAGAAGMTDPLTGGSANPQVAAVAGGMVHYFESAASIKRIEKRLADANRKADRNRTAVMNHGLGFLQASGGPTGEDGEPPVEETPYMDNSIDVLFIRVDFSDFPGEPVSKAALESTLSSVHTHVANYSYNQASISYTVTPTLYRMPATGASYAASGDNGALIAAARTLASANHTLANYDVVAVFFPTLGNIPGSKITYGGLASVGGSNHWINGYNSVDIILHEFGHNFGLFHANYWDPDHDFDLIADYNDPAGNSYEYGDIFDVMGDGDAPRGYFNPFATSRLEWLPESKVMQPTASGTWRIHRFDDPNALSNQTLALRVPMGGDVYYWVGLRKRFGSPYNLANAAYVVAEGLYANRPNLIDMTPGSSGNADFDRRDSGLPVNGVLDDSTYGVKFETLASGGTSPNEWIDVRVTFESRVAIVDIAPEVQESAGTALVTLRRSFGGTGTVTATYTTANGTAVSGTDYYPASGTVTWTGGDTADKIIRVPIRPDALNEGRETFSLQLVSAIGATIDAVNHTAEVTIVDAGKQLLRFEPDFFNTVVTTIAPLPDGKVVIGGTIHQDGGPFADIYNIARLNADGTVDETFQTGTGFNGQVTAVVAQPDGKLLVAGSFTTYNGTTCNRITRLNANGTLDTSFNTALGTGPNNTVYSMAVETGGTILVGGSFTGFNGATANGIIRLASTGAAAVGSVLNLPFATSSTIRDILVQQDGKIMVGGSFYITGAPVGFRSGIARLNADGTRDTSFEPGAGAHDTATNAIRSVYKVVRQNDGKYMICGDFIRYNQQPAANVARVNANGSHDGSFTSATLNPFPRVMVVQPSGRVVLGGTFTSPANRIVGLTAAGVVDTGFAIGSGTTQGNGSVQALALGIDGGVWVGGNFFNYDGVDGSPVVKVAGGTTAYAVWVASKFSAADFTANLTDVDDDPDGDGLRNGAEYALGTDPKTANAGPSAPLAGFATSGPNRYLQLSADRSAAATGVWAVAQFSSNLTSWSPAAPVPGSNATYDVIEDTGAKVIVRDKTAAGTAPKRFGRILYKLPE